jgi:hypothetical protein
MVDQHQPILPERSLTSIFKPNTATAILRARQALDHAENKIQEISVARTAAMQNADDASAIEEIQRLDNEMAAHRHAASIYHERIGALLEKRRDDERGRLEREKIEAIAEIGKRATRRRNAAKNFDEATVVYLAAIGRLQAADEALFKNWPSILPYPYQAESISSIPALGQKALEKTSPFAPPPVIKGTLRALIDRGSFDMGDFADGLTAQMMARLESYEIPESQKSDVDQENAA